MKIRAILLLNLLILSYSLFAQGYTIQSVPNPKNDTSDNYVSNPDHIISADAESAINYLADSLERHNGVEVAVVLLSSVGDIHIKDFAVELFNYWGIGKKNTDNGLLILFVSDQRSVTFETGYGIEGDLPDAICKRIQMEHMVPYFKKGDYDKGMIEGFSAAADVLEKGSYEYDMPQKTFWERYPFLIYIIAISSVVFLIAFITICLRYRSAKREESYDSYFKVQNLSYWALGLALLSPILIILYMYLRYGKNKIRTKARPCQKCGRVINERLDEIADDKYLPPSKVKEESLKSVDYDVWLCPSCNNVEVLTYPQRSRYSQCPSCKTIAYHMISDRVLSRATTSRSGVGVRDYRCEFCEKGRSVKYAIPRIQASSSGSGGSGGGSGGGSWGGGSSGGGGATSSW
ncbi:MAG: TPM domain-containing protein [Dysgonomonas sp.]